MPSPALTPPTPPLAVPVVQTVHIKAPLHLAGGNERDLIETFKNIGPQDWVLGTNGKWVTMGIPSKGEYEIPAEVIYGFPVICENGEYKMVEGLDIDAFSRERMTHTLNELLEEQAGVKHLLS